MNVIVDEQCYQGPGIEAATIGELAQIVCQETGGGEKRMVVHVVCDGAPVAPDRLDQVLADAPGQYSKIELQTQPLRVLVHATLAQAVKVFEDISAKRETIADALEAGEQNDAMQQLRDLFGTWKQVQDCLAASVAALGLSTDQLATEAGTLEEVLDSVKTQLTELKDAMNGSDFVVVGDILRYELEEPFQQWLALLNRACELSADGSVMTNGST